MFQAIWQAFLVRQIRQQVKQRSQAKTLSPKQIQVYHRLNQSPLHWKAQDFEELAALIGTSSSTVKRIFKVRGYQFPERLSKANQQALLRFLGIASWKALETKLFEQLFKKIIGEFEQQAEAQLPD